MKRIGHYAVGILQGSEVLFSDFEEGSEMWTGAGQRDHRHYVRFEEYFRDTPAVHVGFSMWDIHAGANQRVDLHTKEIDTEGFAIVFSTWSNTRVARIRVDWLAIGPVTFEEDFDL